MNRKTFFVAVSMLLAIVVLTAQSCYEESSSTQNSRSNERIAKTAINAVEVPVPQYFMERQKVRDWFMAWDTPNAISYLYIFTQQGCIGYFIVDGKPISNQSYLTPEEEYYTNGAVLQTPSLDGTYGSDNTGIRFKSANGVWHEFGGTNFSYLYANQPIPGLSQVKLGE